MILVDTAIWIDHFRSNHVMLLDLLNDGQILAHPFVIGEVAMGSINSRSPVLEFFAGLPTVSVAEDNEVLRFVDLHKLYGLGIGYVGAHLLTSARLTPGTTLWTRDKRLRAAAERLSLAAKLAH